MRDGACPSVSTPMNSNISFAKVLGTCLNTDEHENVANSALDENDGDDALGIDEEDDDDDDELRIDGDDDELRIDGDDDASSFIVWLKFNVGLFMLIWLFCLA